jgi:hypothetical protein
MATKVMLPYKGRTGQIEIEVETATATVPVGPFRFVNGARKGQFVPLATIRRNLAVLVDRLARQARRKG